MKTENLSIHLLFRLKTLRHPSVVAFIEARLPPELDGASAPGALGNHFRSIYEAKFITP